MANKKTKCTSYVQGHAMRVTKLDACGRPVVGDNSVVTSDGFISIGYTANTDDGEEISQKNARGKICVRIPAKPSFLGYTLEVQFCNVDPDIVSLMTGQQQVVDANGVVVGFAMNSDVSSSDHYFALEVWAGAESEGGCEDGAEGKYGYILVPFVQGGIVGDFTIENGAVTFTISNASSKGGNSWGTGPYLVTHDAAGDPAVLPAALDTNDHLYLIEVPLAPPEPECGARPYMVPSSAAVTSATATPTDLSVEFSPAPAGSDPFWVDFGDGYWDYSDDGSDLTHLYDEAGTYTWTLYRGNSHTSGSVSPTTP